jgi:hypothetical protein
MVTKQTFILTNTHKLCIFRHNLLNNSYVGITPFNCICADKNGSKINEPNKEGEENEILILGIRLMIFDIVK